MASLVLWREGGGVNKCRTTCIPKAEHSAYAMDAHVATEADKICTRYRGKKKMCINRYAVQFKFEFHFECRSVGRFFVFFIFGAASAAARRYKWMNGKRNSHLTIKCSHRHDRVFCRFNCSYIQI